MGKLQHQELNDTTLIPEKDHSISFTENIKKLFKFAL